MLFVKVNITVLFYKILSILALLCYLRKQINVSSINVDKRINYFGNIQMGFAENKNYYGYWM